LINENQDWAHGFALAYDSHAKGVSSGSLIYIQYISLVYSLEKMALMLMPYADKIGKGLHSTVHEEFCKKYPAFTSYNLESIIPILVNCERTKGAEKYVREVVKVSLNSKSTESDEKYIIDRNALGGHEVSEEFGAALLYGAAGVLVAITVVHAIRYMLYSMSCLTIDISKSLADQAYTVYVGIESLASKQAKYKETDKEYKRLEKIMKKQTGMFIVMVQVANAIAGEDMETPDEIRKKEREDNEEIEDEETGGNSGGDNGSLDI